MTKRITLMAVLAFMAVAPSLAQYARHGYQLRPLLQPYRSNYQTGYRRPRILDTYFGLRLGLTAATVNATDNALEASTPRVGLNVGFVAGIQLAPVTPLYLETGLSYTEKGGKKGAITSVLNFLEVPLLVKYQHNFTPLLSLQPFAGIYGAIGVGGKIKDGNRRQRVSAFGDNTFRRADAGIRLGCGLQYDHLYAELSYDVGLSNLSHDSFYRAHTGTFFANVGVNF